MLCCGLMLTTITHANMIIKELISGLMSSIEKHTGPKRRRFLVVVVVVVVGMDAIYDLCVYVFFEIHINFKSGSRLHGVLVFEKCVFRLGHRPFVKTCSPR